MKQGICIANCKSRKFLRLNMKAGDFQLEALRQNEDNTRIFLHVNDVKEYLLIIKEKGGEQDELTSGRKDRTFL